ncbi:MAG TPA: hypothetical protein DIU15_17210, partial [Deltaproteobacteria bacterium]|nr:hypothetical protein [Deltaproteobacteria bacterium]
MKSRLLAPLSLCALLLAGCDGDWTVPETNTQDFRISFTEAEVTDSCVNAQDGEPEQDPTAMVRASDNFDPFEQIYRIHFPEGSEDPRFDLYWKHEGDRESDFAFFAAGTLQGTME